MTRMLDTPLMCARSRLTDKAFQPPPSNLLCSIDIQPSYQMVTRIYNIVIGRIIEGCY